MNRVIFADIPVDDETKQYPLLFSLGVLDKIKEHGDIKSVMDKLKDMTDTGAFIDLVCALSDAGSKRMKRYEDLEYEPVHAEDLELLGFREALTLRDKVYETIAAGFEEEVDGKSNAKKKEKK